MLFWGYVNCLRLDSSLFWEFLKVKNFFVLQSLALTDGNFLTSSQSSQLQRCARVDSILRRLNEFILRDYVGEV